MTVMIYVSCDNTWATLQQHVSTQSPDIIHGALQNMSGQTAGFLDTNVATWEVEIKT
jgi:hypothetical protein